MQRTTTCIECKKVYSVKGIHTHYARAHLKETKYFSGNNGKYDEISKIAQAKRLHKIAEYEKSPSYCKGCKEPLQYVKRTYKFCSHSCSASFIDPNKIRIKKLRKRHNPDKLYYKMYRCAGCDKDFKYHRHKKFCNKLCQDESRIKNKDIKYVYRLKCKFNFNLKDYPNYFDFSLIENYGWYHPVKNPNGVSRDHMISVSYGFKNNIDPAIISHPANCQLMQHSKNLKKNYRNSISLDELKIKIKEFSN